MKRIYWRPKSVSRPALVFVAILSAALMLVVETRRHDERRMDYDAKLAAAQLAERGFAAIKPARLASGPPIDRDFDPAESGLIGVAMSRVTSVPGDLVAKQTTVNPNFAAAIVEMLHAAGVERGDRVAVGVSGSFPALNICVYAALETVGAEPIVVASGAASQFGANAESLMWIDMERLFVERGVFHTKSIAASLGGYHDSAKNLSPEGAALIRQSMAKCGVPLLDADTFEASVKARMDVYQRAAGAAPIKAYINVGGGSASVGRRGAKHKFAPGLNMHPPSGMTEADGVMERFSRDGVPVLHLVQIVELARRYGLPIAPTTTPAPGEGAAEKNVFAVRQVNRPLAAAAIATILLALYVVVRWDLRTLTIRRVAISSDETTHTPMV